jgi:hypothetical protein
MRGPGVLGLLTTRLLAERVQSKDEPSATDDRFVAARHGRSWHKTDLCRAGANER